MIKLDIDILDVLGYYDGIASAILKSNKDTFYLHLLHRMSDTYDVFVGVKINNDIYLQDFLNGKVTIYDLLRSGKNYICTLDNGHVNMIQINLEMLNQRYLPSQGVFLTSSNPS